MFYNEEELAKSLLCVVLNIGKFFSSAAVTVFEVFLSEATGQEISTENPIFTESEDGVNGAKKPPSNISCITLCIRQVCGSLYGSNTNQQCSPNITLNCPKQECSERNCPPCICRQCPACISNQYTHVEEPRRIDPNVRCQQWRSWTNYCLYQCHYSPQNPYCPWF